MVQGSSLPIGHSQPVSTLSPIASNLKHPVLALSTAILSMSCGHQKIVLAPDSIDSIRIFGGDTYYRSRTTVNHDTIRQICTLLRLATPVSLDTVNVRDHSVSCFMYIAHKSEGMYKFSYGDTRRNGYILWYRANHYRLDGLNQYLR